MHQARFAPTLAAIAAPEQEEAAHVGVGRDQSILHQGRILVKPGDSPQTGREHEGPVGPLDECVVVVAGPVVRPPARFRGEIGDVERRRGPSLARVGGVAHHQLGGVLDAVRQPEPSVAADTQGKGLLCRDQAPGLPLVPASGQTPGLGVHEDGPVGMPYDSQHAPDQPRALGNDIDRLADLDLDTLPAGRVDRFQQPCHTHNP